MVETWKPEEKSVSNNLALYNVGESKQVRNYIDVLLQKAEKLVEDNRTVELPVDESTQDVQQETEENQGTQLIKLAGNEYAQTPSINQLSINKWLPVRLKEEDKIESRDEIKKYLGCEVEDAFLNLAI